MDPLFGSETRGRVLEQLASSGRPQSAYGIALAVGAEPIQVIGILRRLGDHTRRSKQGWELVDEDLRRFLRARISRRERQLRTEKDEILVRYGLKARKPHGRRRAR